MSDSNTAAVAAVTGRRVPIGHAEIYVEEHGPSHGSSHGSSQGVTRDPVLLVAGLGGSGRFWSAQVADFAREFRVILHDHRGVGRSGPGPIISNARDLADDLLRVMDALDIERAHLVGHSTGGAIGQHIALRAPERLASLVLSASWAGPTPLFVQTFHTRRDILINSGPLNYLMTGTLLAAPAWYLNDRFKDARSFFETRLAEFPGLEVELGRLNAVMSHDLRHQLGAIRVPTFVIGARDDQLTPSLLSEELAQRIPGARLCVLREGGHFCPQTVTAEYNAAVLGFLLEQSARSHGERKWQEKMSAAAVR
ncbi:MAG: alpha/beta fold hydrolase [Gammaproteobacteria bacterium]|nr:alpha/beta fold hydrolase [Gammaproteobacteria bacterium]